MYSHKAVAGNTHFVLNVVPLTTTTFTLSHSLSINDKQSVSGGLC
jgi:hypothetical protein